MIHSSHTVGKLPGELCLSKALIRLVSHNSVSCLSKALIQLVSHRCVSRLSMALIRLVSHRCVSRLSMALPSTSHSGELWLFLLSQVNQGGVVGKDGKAKLL